MAYGDSKSPSDPMRQRNAVGETDQYQQSRCEKKKVVMLFAHMKRILRLDRLRLRGRSGALDEFTLAAAVQNLRQQAKLTSLLQHFGGKIAPAALKIW